jgi:hypothetical protein
MVWKQVFILIGMTLVLLVATIAKTKKRLE